MKIQKRNRKFLVGKNKNISLVDKGSIFLKNNENISIQFNSKMNFDIVKKNWGFYALPSINKRLKKFKLNAVIVESKNFKNFFILLVAKDKKKISAFKDYCKKENLKIIIWLNDYNFSLIKKYFKV